MSTFQTGERESTNELSQVFGFHSILNREIDALSVYRGHGYSYMPSDQTSNCTAENQMWNKVNTSKVPVYHDHVSK